MQESNTLFFNNAFWKFTEIFFKKIISLIVSTILARLLSPSAYGIVALTTVFVAFSDVFLLNGFNIALIRKEHIEDLDYSTVMFLGLLFSSILYFIFVFSADNIAVFYKTEELSKVLPAITSILFIQAISSVIKAKGTREYRFKEMSIASVIGSLVSSIVGIFFALNEAGVWALVAQQISHNLIEMLLLLIFFRWKFDFQISWKSAKEMVSFSLGVLGASFLDFCGSNISSLMISKQYSPTELGYYNRGNAYPETIGLNTYSAINCALLPMLSAEQNNNSAMKEIVRKSMSITAYVLFPMMFGFIAISETFVHVVLTDKWTPAIPILVFACINYAINPIRSIGVNVFYAKGQSSRSVRIEIFRTVIMILSNILIIMILKQSIYVLAIVGTIITLSAALITQTMVQSLIGYEWKELLHDVSPTLFMSLLMVVIVKLIQLIPLSATVIFLLQIAIGVSSYILLSILTKNSCFLYLKESVMKKWSNNHARK